VLFKTTEEAKKAANKLNQTKIGEKHIRVDVESGEKKENDCECSIFVGNMPWVS